MLQTVPGDATFGPGPTFNSDVGFDIALSPDKKAFTATFSGLQAIIDGWGPPTAAGDQSGFPTMIYEDGLIVVFERQGQWADSMTFTVPQPLPAPTAGAAPAAQLTR